MSEKLLSIPIVPFFDICYYFDSIFHYLSHFFRLKIISFYRWYSPIPKS